MGFQALFKLVKCWRALDIVRVTVPSRWSCDSERTLVVKDLRLKDENKGEDLKIGPRGQGLDLRTTTLRHTDTDVHVK